MQLPVTVKKRDGSIEEFQPDKISRVIKAAGLTEKQAELLVNRITDWVVRRTETPLSSLIIRDQVLHELESIYKPAADMFAWYQKTKETHV